MDVPLSSKCMKPAGNSSLLGSSLHPPEPYIAVPTTGIVLTTPLLLMVDVWYTFVLLGSPQAVAGSTVDIALPSNGMHEGDE